MKRQRLTQGRIVWMGLVATGVGMAMITAACGRADEPPATVDSEAIKNLQAAYPKAPEGMERKVIILPHKERGEEDDFQVEIVVGRTIVTDGINRYMLGGELREVDIPGWGFTYWQAEGRLDEPAQTLIGGESKPTPQFVAGPRRLVRYNSRLPLVVMVPAGCEVRWRIWKADPEFTAAAGG